MFIGSFYLGIEELNTEYWMNNLIWSLHSACFLLLFMAFSHSNSSPHFLSVRKSRYQDAKNLHTILFFSFFTPIAPHMSWLHVWKPILVNRSNRPILQDGEDFLCTKDYVGLYQGKLKILARQKGIVYLTNKRIIYFDSNVTSNSVAIELAYISHCEVIEKFFRSSPKIKAYLKTSGKGKETESSLEEQPKEPKQITWICKICSYSNTISLDFDLDNELPKCVSCGIRPNLSLIHI